MVILWKRLDLSGHEWCRLSRTSDGKHLLEGVVVVAYPKNPCSIEYSITCGASWETEEGEISGKIGRKDVALRLKVNRQKQWYVNGHLVPSVKGCVDVDLGFSPSTNLFPIRRLRLARGERADVTAAWVEFPTFKLKPLRQQYSKIEHQTYRYESAGGTFRRDLVVDRNGIVRTYPGLWETESVI